MADHVRRQLREAVATAVTGLATTGARVFQSRVYPVQSAEMPGLLVYTTGEEVTDQSVGMLIGRVVQVLIEGQAKAAADLDDVLDQISKEVEIALSSTVTVGGKPVLLNYEGCDISLDEASKPTGVLAMRFNALIYTQRSTPDVNG